MTELLILTVFSIYTAKLVFLLIDEHKKKLKKSLTKNKPFDIIESSRERRSKI